jgi:steroid delta-isomerase-like uncharacterized protein
MFPDPSTYASTINDAWYSHDFEQVIRCYSPECTGDDVGQAYPFRGHEGLRTMLETYWRAFPDLQITVTDTIIDDPRLAIAWVAQATHLGPIMNIPPTGRSIQVRGVSIIEVQDGLVMRGRHIWDLAGMLRNLGLLPEL